MVEHSKKFWVTELLTRKQKFEKRKLHQCFNGIFRVLDDFQFSENAHGIKPRACGALPVNSLLVKMESYKEVLDILRSSLFNAIHVGRIKALVLGFSQTLNSLMVLTMTTSLATPPTTRPQQIFCFTKNCTDISKW